MSNRHLVICDGCGVNAGSEYNGEHWLPPDSWATLVSNNFCVEDFGQHLCPTCVNKLDKGERENGRE